MNSDKVLFNVNGKNVSGVIHTPENLKGQSKTGLILAHGAANDMNHPLIVSLSEGLAEEGYITLRFNFPYKEEGRKSPDSQETLIKTWASAYKYLKSHSGYKIENVIAVGKSMGGRIASQMVADGLMDIHGLIFLGYPLHAPGKKDRLKDAHLYEIKVPMLFFAGTRDQLCDLTLLNAVLNRLKGPCELEIIEGGDHSFKMPKASTITYDDVTQNILQKCLHWLRIN